MGAVRQDSTPKAKEGVVALGADDDVVLYDPEDDRVHLLNITAAAIYELCDGENTVEEITRLASDEMLYSTPGLANDVIQLCTSLMEEGLLR